MAPCACTTGTLGPLPKAFDILWPIGAAHWPYHCCGWGSCFHLALCVEMWVKGTLGLLNNPRLWPYWAPSFPWPVALAGTQCFFSILPRLLFLTPGVGTRACKEGGTTFSWLPPSLPPSGFFQSGYTPRLLPQPISSLCPSFLFLGDCTPHSCFCNHIHPWSPYLSSQHPLPPSTYWHLLPK